MHLPRALANRLQAQYLLQIAEEQRQATPHERPHSHAEEGVHLLYVLFKAFHPVIATAAAW